MSRVKASGSMTIHKMVQKKGAEAAQRFLARLAPGTRETLLHELATSWIPIEQEEEIFRIAADCLYPGDPEALRRLGQSVAEDNFNGIYKIFLRIPTPEFIIRRIPQTWSTLHDEGQACVEDYHDNCGTLVARSIPDLPAVQREYICGYIVGILSLTSAKRISVSKIETDPQAWKWRIAFE
jgi:hypothetical protein